jgi:hypothetical protein
MNNGRLDVVTGLGGTQLNDLVVLPEYVEDLKKQGLDSLDALFAARDVESLHKPGLEAWRERLRLSFESDGRRHVFYLKRFTRPPLKIRREVRLAGGLARSVAGMEFEWSRRLAAENIPAVEAIAFGAAFRGRRELRSAVLLAEVRGESLEQWCLRHEGYVSNSDRALVGALLEETASLTARFHRSGYVHRDLYLSHLFLDESSTKPPHVRLIDLQRIRRPKWRMLRWIVKDLAALDYSTPTTHVSRSDRLRWLTRYLAEANLEVRRRSLVYRIAGKSLAMARHDRRRLVRKEG